MNEQAKKSRIDLGLKGSTLLCNWLVARRYVSTDSYATIADEAAKALNDPRINTAHVRERMRQFELNIPAKPADPMTPEAKDRAIACALQELYSQFGLIPHGDVLGYLVAYAS